MKNQMLSLWYYLKLRLKGAGLSYGDLPPQVWVYYGRAGVAPMELVDMDGDELRFAYSVDFEEVTQDLFKDGSKALRASPHFELAQAFATEGVEAALGHAQQFRYHEFFLRFNRVGLKSNLMRPGETHKVHHTPDTVLAKMKRMGETFRTMRDPGYLAPGNEQDYISVLDRPLVATRFGREVPHKDGYEVFSGHHRAASLLALGQQRFPVLKLKDVGL